MKTLVDIAAEKINGQSHGYHPNNANHMKHWFWATNANSDMYFGPFKTIGACLDDAIETRGESQTIFVSRFRSPKKGDHVTMVSIGQLRP